MGLIILYINIIQNLLKRTGDKMATDREHKIMHMFYNWDEERKVMLDMQKCQRNWDYAKWKSINPELRKACSVTGIFGSHLKS